MTIQEIFNFLNEGLEVASRYLLSTTKRTHYIYLISSLVLAYYVYFKSKQKNKSFLQYIFAKKVWWSRSAFVDYTFIFFNSFIKILLIGPFLIYGLLLAYYTNEYMAQWFGFSNLNLSSTETIIYYTIVLTLISDFLTFLVHYACHKVRFLWEFHKIHHSATSMNPFTQYRLHPVELILNNVKSIIVFGLVTGLFDYLSNQQVDKWTYLGVNAFSLLFYTWGANLRHSHVKLRFFNFLEYIFISPLQHQVHHSDNPKHFDKNMGSRLAIWDWMFGTLVRSNQTDKLVFGLGEKDNKNYNSFFKNLSMPFVNIYRLILRKRKRHFSNTNSFSKSQNK
ncbi:MAG: sterol desaturase family protein [Flavicella sp.]